MADPSNPLTVVSGGMSRLRVKGAARRDVAYQISDAYVTAANTVKKRPGTIRNVDLSALGGAGNSKGLVAHQGALHVFSAQKVAVPAGYVDHVLTHPANNKTFTPPNPASSATGWNPVVQSLLHFEEGNGSTAFTDGGTNPSTWTVAGAATESTAQAKFGAGSMTYTPQQFSAQGASTPLTTGSNTDVYSGNGDFTIEFWVYPTNLLAGHTVSMFDAGQNQSYGLFIFNNGTQVSVGSGAGNFSSLTFPASSLTANAWNHIAVARDGNYLRLFVNGAQATPAKINTNFGNPPANTNTTIGRAVSAGESLSNIYYIDEFRITKGVCLYGASFNPPSSALTTAAAPTYAIAELMHFDDGNGSVAFTDSIGAQTWAAVGVASESTAQFKFGSGSGIFANAADYIKTSVTAGVVADITAGGNFPDFTFECFYRPSSVGAGTYVIADYTETASGTPGATGFRLSSTGPSCVVNVFPSNQSVTAANVFTATSTWYHLAVTARSNTYYLWVNGVLAGSTAVTSRPAIATGSRHFIGGQFGSNVANGYIDEVRLVTGLAVYIAAFTPPAAPFTAPGVVPILLKEIHYATPFMGFLYVVAEFTSDGGSGLGTVFHYWLQTSGTWKASTIYQVGQIVSPSVANGLAFQATRLTRPNPGWAPNTLTALNAIVEPNTANGYKFTATAVDGLNPITGAAEPTWPATDGAKVYEESEKTNTGVVATAAPQPSLVTTPSPGVATRYGNLYSNKTTKP